MKISEEIEAVELHIDAIQKVVDSLKERLKRVDRAWPDHQVIPFCEWNDRSMIPPEGMIWASDGIAVWLIRSDGEGISKGATSVKYWSPAFIPSPPQNGIKS